MRTDAACASLPCVFTLSKSRRTFVLRSVSPSSVSAFSFSPHPVVSGRPAYIRAPGAPSTSFFAAPRFSEAPGGEDHLRQSRFPFSGSLRFSGAGFLPQRRHAVNFFFCVAEVFSATNGEVCLRFTSRHLDDYFVASAGPVFYLGAGAPSTSFFAPLKFFQRQAEKFTSALLLVNLTITSSHQRGAVSTSAPPRRQPLFSSRRNFRPDTSAKPLPPSAPPTPGSLRPSGRPVCSPGQRVRQPLFYRLVTIPSGWGRNLRIFPSPKPGKGKNALSSIH